MKPETSMTSRIKYLKQKHQAVILVHNYQRPEIHEIADFVGDSLELSRQAASTPARVIVFCGVHFMAETASILSPEKTVLLPEINAGCPMADMITPVELQERRRQLPGYSVVTYVNSSAAVKAFSDVCCTSSNAVKVVDSLENDNILFVPDKFLGSYVKSKTQKNLVLWPGYCPVHARIMPQHIIKRKQEHPDAPVLAHPECRPEVIQLADEVLSTGGMVKYARSTRARQMIIATDAGMLYRLGKENPDKVFVAASTRAKCPNMQLTRLGSVLKALQQMAPEVKIPEDTRSRAYRAVERMIELG